MVCPFLPSVPRGIPAYRMSEYEIDRKRNEAPVSAHNIALAVMSCISLEDKPEHPLS